MSKGEGLMPVPSPAACAALTVNFFTAMGEGVWFLVQARCPGSCFPPPQRRCGGLEGKLVLVFRLPAGLLWCCVYIWISTTPVCSLLMVYFWVWKQTGRTTPKSGGAQVSLLHMGSEIKKKIFTPSYYSLHRRWEVSYEFKSMICKRVASSCFS